MKFVFVGDIHGKVECVEDALSREGMKIFVGDFMDSFDRSPKDMGKCLELVLSAIEKGEAQAIYGNHELSYMRNGHQCSGYSTHNLYALREFDDKIVDHFRPYILLAPNFLVSHAGFTNQLWTQHNLTLETLAETLDSWWAKVGSPIDGIGRCRGGLQKVGGLFWCDFNYEFQSVPGLTQVFGHTAGKGIRQKEDSYCIDCLDRDRQFLEMEI